MAKNRKELSILSNSIPGPFEAPTNVIGVKDIRNTCHYQYLKETFVHFEYMGI